MQIHKEIKCTERDRPEMIKRVQWLKPSAKQGKLKMGLVMGRIGSPVSIASPTLLTIIVSHLQ